MKIDVDCFFSLLISRKTIERLHLFGGSFLVEFSASPMLLLLSPGGAGEEEENGDCDEENPEDLHLFNPLIVDFISSQALPISTASSKFTLGNFRRCPSGVACDEYANRNAYAVAMDAVIVIRTPYSTASLRGLPIVGGSIVSC